MHLLKAIGGTCSLLLVSLGLLSPSMGPASADVAASPIRWHKVPTEPYRLNDKQDAIAFANPRLGLYGNGTGRIFRTEDGGQHWRLVWRQAGTYVQTLEFVDDRTAFMGNVGPGYITDMPVVRGFVYLAAVVDWFSRRMLSWRVPITMEAGFCIEAVEEALARHCKPEIMNTDQGSQFTGHAFTGVTLAAGIAISMDGKGSLRDNVFIERLWRSVEYEEVYLNAFSSVGESRASIDRSLALNNGRKPNSRLDRQTPDQALFTRLPQTQAA